MITPYTGTVVKKRTSKLYEYTEFFKLYIKNSY